jgi:hypothetical protein
MLWHLYMCGAWKYLTWHSKWKPDRTIEIQSQHKLFPQCILTLHTKYFRRPIEATLPITDFRYECDRMLCNYLETKSLVLRAKRPNMSQNIAAWQLPYSQDQWNLLSANTGEISTNPITPLTPSCHCLMNELCSCTLFQGIMKPRKVREKYQT